MAESNGLVCRSQLMGDVWESTHSSLSLFLVTRMSSRAEAAVFRPATVANLL